MRKQERETVKAWRGCKITGGMTKGIKGGAGACTRYLSNTAMLLLNKHLLGGYGFRFPVFLTACHMAACVLMSQARLPLPQEP